MINGTTSHTRISTARRSAAIILNPVAGRARAPATADKLQRLLACCGVQAEIFATTRPGHASDLAVQYAPEFDAIAGIGGDGTINEIINGLCDSRSRTPLAVIPCGTANVMAQELRLPRTLSALARMIADSPTRALDLAHTGERHFALCCGAGIDARVVRRVSALRSEHGIRMHDYIIPCLHEMLAREFPPLRVSADGKVLCEDCTFAVAGNMKHYGGPFRLFNNAVPDDGLLDILCFRGRNAGDYLRLALQSLFHQVHPDRNVIIARGRDITIEQVNVGAEVPLQIDGDSAGAVPVRIGLRPQAVHFCVSDEEC